MRFGVISDIHGNFHALQAVLCRLGAMQVDEIICLGDIVGYGPNPAACLDLVYKHCLVIVRGNHDEAVVNPDVAMGFNGPARDAIGWTRQQLGPLQLDALHRMKATAVVERSVLCTHASPVSGPDDYVHDKRAAAVAFGGLDRPVCMLGHTHVPMIFEAPADDGGAMPAPAELIAYLPRAGENHELAPDRRYILNPGSVGQPRDCDPRASFAVFDSKAKSFTVFRQEYDILAAQQASERAGLPTVLADRLAVGA
jgi:predicted phosphodiesterase